MKRALNLQPSNLAPPDPEKLDLMREITGSVTTPGYDGALSWSPETGYALDICEGDMPDQVRYLSYCFIRLCEDPEFGDELHKWIQRNQN